MRLKYLPKNDEKIANLITKHGTLLIQEETDVHGNNYLSIAFVHENENTYEKFEVEKLQDDWVKLILRSE